MLLMRCWGCSRVCMDDCCERISKISTGLSTTPPSNKSSSMYCPAQILAFSFESTRPPSGTDENELILDARVISPGCTPSSGNGGGYAVAPAGVVNGGGYAVAPAGVVNGGGYAVAPAGVVDNGGSAVAAAQVSNADGRGRRHTGQGRHNVMHRLHLLLHESHLLLKHRYVRVNGSRADGCVACSRADSDRGVTGNRRWAVVVAIVTVAPIVTVADRLLLVFVVACSNLAGARRFLPRLLSMAGCCNLKRANRS